MGKDKTASEVITSEEIQIINATDKYVMVGDFRFEFGHTQVNFNAVVNSLDNSINEFRNKCIRRIAEELKMEVKFQE